VVIVFLAFVSWMVDVAGVDLDLVVPGSLSTKGGNSSALSRDFEWNSLLVFVGNLSHFLWITSFWEVVFDLVLEPGILLVTLNLGNSNIDISDSLLGEIKSLCFLLRQSTLESSSGRLKLIQESPWVQKISILGNRSSPALSVVFVVPVSISWVVKVTNISLDSIVP